MTTSINGHSDDADLTAAEFVLGTLSNGERSALEARFAYYPSWRVLVGRWADRLQPLAEAIPPVEPPPALRARIMAAAKVTPFTRMLRTVPRSVWRIGSFASAAALLVAAMLLWPQAPMRMEIATIGDATVPALVTIAADADRTELIVSSGLPLPPVDRDFELWVIPSDGSPRSLGVIAGAVETLVKLPAAVRAFIAADSVLAVSVEPVGGSPSGKPTGPVIYTGKIVSATRG
nr:anti-sigma factor [uncultured Dongia sp.]